MFLNTRSCNVILLIGFWARDGNTKRSESNGNNIFKLFPISLLMQFLFVAVIGRHFNFARFLRLYWASLVMILSCVSMQRIEHMLSFLCFYFYAKHLTYVFMVFAFWLNKYQRSPEANVSHSSLTCPELHRRCSQYVLKQN